MKPLCPVLLFPKDPIAPRSALKQIRAKREVGTKGSLRTEATGCPLAASLPLWSSQAPRRPVPQTRLGVTREGTSWKGQGKATHGEGRGRGGEKASGGLEGGGGAPG